MKTLALALLLASAPLLAQEREVAFTYDDLPLGGPAIPIERMERVNGKLLAGLREAQVPAIGFVNERKLYEAGEVDRRIALLQGWLDGGLELGNHTYAHRSFFTTPPGEFQEEVARGETVTRWLLERAGKQLRWFRHPFLNTGPTVEAKRSFEAFLAGRGYRVAPVTLDNSDWIFALVYARALGRGDAEEAKRVGAAFLTYLDVMLTFWEELTQSFLKRPMRHVMLLHESELNADHVGGVTALFARRGYRFVTLDRALEDEAYRLEDAYAGRAGISWLHRWMVTKGLPMKLKEEPEPPDWLMARYRALTN